MSSDLTIEDLSEFLASRVLATLATYGADGLVRLSPVWFEWADGGFNVVVAAGDIKARHLRRDRRASLTVYENHPPYRGVEIRAEAHLSETGAAEIERRLAHRYLGERGRDAYLASASWEPLHVRLVPGDLRVWDLGMPDYEADSQV